MINLVQDISSQYKLKCERKGHCASSYWLIDFSGVMYFLKQEKRIKMIHGHTWLTSKVLLETRKLLLVQTGTNKNLNQAHKVLKGN